MRGITTLFGVGFACVVVKSKFPTCIDCCIGYAKQSFTFSLNVGKAYAQWGHTVYNSTTYYDEGEHHHHLRLQVPTGTYMNEINGTNTMLYDSKGYPISGIVSFTHTLSSHSSEIKEYIEGDYVKQEMQKRYDIFNQEYPTQMTFEMYYKMEMSFLLNQSERDRFTYQPSNLYRDEIDAYNAMLQGANDGWYTLSNIEILEIKYNLELYQSLLERAFKYESINGIQPTGEGFINH